MGKAKGIRRKGPVLERLNAEEAQDVLRRLLAAHPALRAEAEAIARSRLGEATFETIADEVQEAVRTLDINDLNGRAGRHEWGYVEPTEAAWEILEEAVEPFIADISRRLGLGLKADALEICKGVVLGLYRVQQGKGSDLAEWAPDFPAEAACEAITAWRGGRRAKKRARGRQRREGRAFPRDFVEHFVPEWRAMIARISR
jgi:hypothetical protein